METTVFSALADQHRRLILQLLKAHPTNVGDIRNHLPITGPTLSHHLDILKRAGLVTVERRGRHLWYRLDPSPLPESIRFLQSLLDQSPSSES